MLLLSDRFKRMRLTIHMVWVSYCRYKKFIRVPTHGLKDLLKSTFRHPFRHFLLFTRIFNYMFFSRALVNSKNIVVHYNEYRPIGTSLDGLVALAWFCEKMRINIQIKNPSRMVWRHFENDTLINAKNGSEQKFKQPSTLILANDIGWLGTFFVPSEYGHKILSKLSIKEELRQSADKWFDRHIKGEWVAVHYRGTDVRARKRKRNEYKHKHRYRIELDSYVAYLKEVLGDRYSIFACSDQAQFIDKMRIAFPKRVYARDIQRSYDNRPIHLHDISHEEDDNYHQEKDALIDILILSKANLIYTTGSGFVDAVRYFNPKIKIVSLDEREIGIGENNIPIP